MNAPPAVARLSLRGICKRYPSVIANDAIDLEIAPGEIHAVLGENGAGKSTLMKIIYGVTRPDGGEIRWEGQRVAIASPAAARELGIGMVFQHFSLFETLTVAENIALSIGRPQGELHDEIREVSIRYGLPLDPARLVHSLSVGERQRVEIVRCLLQKPRLLIMDEPTSVLTPQAVQQLFATLRRLASEGCSILYISHKLDEIRELCQRATVLRGGRVSGEADPRLESNESLARMMIGGELPACTLPPQAPAEVRLAVRGLSLQSDDPFGTALHDVSLEVRGGEIVGIAGISGNGQQELLAALSGERKLDSAGVLSLRGVAAGKLGPGARRALGLGLGFVPEERLGRGAVPEMSLADNALLTGANRAGMLKGPWIQRRQVREFAREVIARFKVKTPDEDALAQSLSGGNLQKFIIGREVMLEPEVMVVAQPTWGVDVGAAMLIRNALIDLRNRGVAVLVISEELDELFMISDRLAVLADGRLSPAIATQDASVELIGRWMSGDFTLHEARHVPA
ncbi:ABC transporter ATP-binding protein [Craterilacuibacter sp.]|uniref:ABC transporter ATP-binding protein n=1 Tax=Craterilacuibacter sp. TaxID=2870909 RepID=UPI003F3DA583